MEISPLIGSAINFARMLSSKVAVLETGSEIAEKIISIFDDLQVHANPTQQDAMQAERLILKEAVIAKAKKESAALRGEE